MGNRKLDYPQTNKKITNKECFHRKEEEKKKKDLRPNYINLFFKVEIAELYRHTHIILADCLICTLNLTQCLQNVIMAVFVYIFT